MLYSVKVPLMKNKNGDIFHMNNYKSIALPSTVHVCKVLKNVILHKLNEYLWTTNSKFCYIAVHSTDLCVNALTEFIENFKR